MTVAVRIIANACKRDSLEFIDVLKLFIGAAVGGVKPQLVSKPADNAIANSGLKKRPLLEIVKTGKIYFEPNAAVRYLIDAKQDKMQDIARDNSLIEKMENHLAAFILNPTTVEASLREVEVQFDLTPKELAQVKPVDVILFATNFPVLSGAPATLHARFPKLSSWFAKFSAQESVANAIKQAEALSASNSTAPTKTQSPQFTPAELLASRKVRSEVVAESPKPGAVLLPDSNKENVLVTSALPYVNNVPHLGNIIGSTLSADVFARYKRVRKGCNVLYICGTDEYGTATETKALEEKTTCQELCDKYFKLHKQIYEWFDIGFDHFGRTTTEKQKEIAQRIFLQLHENGYLSEHAVTQLFCEQCKRFLADRFVEGICPKCHYEDARGDQCDKCGSLLNANELIKPRCKLDGNSPISKDSTHIFLDLDKLQPKCEEWFTRTSAAGKWSANSTTITRSWIRDGLKPRCITRDLKWGVPVPLEHLKEKVFYVWFDACIGYVSITANYTDWEKWWKNPENVKLYQFMGKDNVPFHTVIFPSSQLGTGDNWTMLHQINTTEYLQYENSKFSKSRNIGVFGNNAKDTGVDVSIWRYFLLSCRPEVSDSSFTWEDFIARTNNELLANFGNFCNRVLKFIDAKYEGRIPDYARPISTEAETKLISDVNVLLKEYIAAMDQSKLKLGLQTAMQISARGNLYLQESNVNNALFVNHPEKCAAVLGAGANLAYLLSALMAPFMPSASDNMCAQLNADIPYVPDVFVIDALLPGHKIGKPAPLFARIPSEKAEEWRLKFGGDVSVVVEETSKISKRQAKKLAKQAAAATPAVAKTAEASSATPTTDAADTATSVGDVVKNVVDKVKSLVL